MSDSSFTFRCNHCSVDYEALTTFDASGKFADVKCPKCESKAKALIGLSVEAAEEIARSECSVLDLSGLVELPDNVATALAKHHGEYDHYHGCYEHGDCLLLDAIDSLSVAAAEAIAKWRGRLLRIGLKTISAETAEALAKSEVIHQLCW